MNIITSDVVTNIFTQFRELIISKLINNPNDRYITILYQSKDLLDLVIKNIGLQPYEVALLMTDLTPIYRHIEEYSAIKLVVNDPSLICLFIATFQDDNIVTHSASAFRINYQRV